eukprot:GHUV01028044.1.p1 GENE.GHUV01028044.1~~GHUV01028044.1.p1  ORF type:complete len:218 (+),score=65.46 GHUV01028044.1:618-1271(+)
MHVSATAISGQRMLNGLLLHWFLLSMAEPAQWATLGLQHTVEVPVVKPQVMFELAFNVLLQELCVYNRTTSKSDAFASSSYLPCKVMPSPAKLAADCSIICMMLTDDKACGSTLQQLCSAGLQGKLVINHSTNSPEFAKAAVGQVASAGGDYISAPVWGRPDAAAAARLVVCPAGPSEAVQRAEAFLAAQGRVLPAQDEPYKSNVMKLAALLTYHSK